MKTLLLLLACLMTAPLARGTPQDHPRVCTVDDLLAFAHRTVHEIYLYPNDTSAQQTSMRLALMGVGIADEALPVVGIGGGGDAEVDRIDLHSIKLYRLGNRFCVSFQVFGTLKVKRGPAVNKSWHMACEVFSDSDKAATRLLLMNFSPIATK
jgi:hypothetical protein